MIKFTGKGNLLPGLNAIIRLFAKLFHARLAIETIQGRDSRGTFDLEREQVT
jgi:hypothetical protein